jgi:hypothetical protein
MCPSRKNRFRCSLRAKGGFDMNRIEEISKTIATMPNAALITLVLLAGFALAGYAIYAVLAVGVWGAMEQ